jgi:hypothetical protein
VSALAYTERVVGRELRPAERVIDVIRIDRELNEAKDQVEQAIRAEMLKATRRWLRGATWRPHLTVTPAMRGPLRRLARFGRDEARAELARLGVRSHVAFDPDPSVPGLDELFDTIAAGLPGLSLRIQQDLVAADLTDASTLAVARALLRVPGARDIASRVVSSALMDGMGAVFEDAGDLVSGWEWSAVLDSGTCGPCDAGDGTQYRTWGEAQADLPNGGPAVVCDGGGRCRCRLVPLG